MSFPSRSSRDQPNLWRSVPWTADDLVRWMTVSALSTALVVVGWYLAAGEANDSDQIVPLNVAIAGVVLGGVANLTWLLRGWHAVGERRKALIGQLQVDVPATGSDRSRAAENEHQSADDLMLVGEASRYFHRPSCPLVANRSWSPAPLGSHLVAGREPCGVCRP
jgi:hypothetical protein